MNARLVFDSSGCRPDLIWVKATNVYLRLHIQRLVTKLCKLTVTKQFPKTKVLDVSFLFELTETPEPSAAGIQRVQGNLLSFYRNIQKSKLEWELGPFSGFLGAPVINLNLPWIMDQWNESQGNKNAIEQFVEGP